MVRPRILSGELQAAEHGEPYEAAKRARSASARTQRLQGRGCATVVPGFQALLFMIERLVTMWRHLVGLLLLLRPTPVGAAVDLDIYGGAFDSSSTIAYAEVGAPCATNADSEGFCNV